MCQYVFKNIHMLKIGTYVGTKLFIKCVYKLHQCTAGAERGQGLRCNLWTVSPEQDGGWL